MFTFAKELVIPEPKSHMPILVFLDLSAEVFSARQHAERAICYRKSVCPSVRLSVCPSVRHTGGSVENG